MLYSERFRKEEVDSEVLDLAERTQARYRTIQEIKDTCEAEHGLNFKVEPEGLPDVRDWTWQPIA